MVSCLETQVLANSTYLNTKQKSLEPNVRKKTCSISIVNSLKNNR
jgi:hypothetical protein